MFSRKPTEVNIHMPTRTEYVTRNVNEHRAPTDASVALLKEMEDAARSKVTESIRVGNTQFECVVHRELDCMNDQVVLRAVFKLNRKQETAEHRYSPRNDGCELDAAVALRDEIAKVIALRMLEGSFSKLFR